MADRVSEDALVPPHLAVDRPRVGIDEELGGVEAMSPLGLVAPVHAVAVALPGPSPGDVDVPDLVGLLSASSPGPPRRSPFPPLVEAQLDAPGIFGEERELDPLPVPRRAEGIGPARPDFQSR